MFHVVFLQQVFDISFLMNENTLLHWFYLQSKKVAQLTIHTHLEFVDHELREICNHNRISRTKNNIVNIYLYQHEVLLVCSTEESRIHHATFETRVDEKG